MKIIQKIDFFRQCPFMFCIPYIMYPSLSLIHWSRAAFNSMRVYQCFKAMSSFGIPIVPLLSSNVNPTATFGSTRYVVAHTCFKGKSILGIPAVSLQDPGAGVEGACCPHRRWRHHSISQARQRTLQWNRDCDRGWFGEREGEELIRGVAVGGKRNKVRIGCFEISGCSSLKRVVGLPRVALPGP